jgi:hypothetical protein
MAIRSAVTPSTLKEIQRSLPREISYTKGLKRAVAKEVQRENDKLLESFEKHPVTIEIAGGVSASNLSGTLNGIGNLFTYIGFTAGSKPLTPIRELLQHYEISYHHIKTKTVITITAPTKEDIFRATPMPWATGRSWAKGIERGISGLGRYLSQPSTNSRSGKGLQVKGRLRTGRFNNTSYLSSLLNKYYKNIKKIEKMTLS